MLSSLLKYPWNLSTLILNGLKYLNDNHKSKEFVEKGYIEDRRIEANIQIEFVLQSNRFDDKYNLTINILGRNDQDLSGQIKLYLDSEQLNDLEIFQKLNRTKINFQTIGATQHKTILAICINGFNNLELNLIDIHFSYIDIRGTCKKLTIGGSKTNMLNIAGPVDFESYKVTGRFGNFEQILLTNVTALSATSNLIFSIFSVISKNINAVGINCKNLSINNCQLLKASFLDCIVEESFSTLNSRFTELMLNECKCNTFKLYDVKTITFVFKEQYTSWIKLFNNNIELLIIKDFHFRKRSGFIKYIGVITGFKRELFLALGENNITEFELWNVKWEYKAIKEESPLIMKDSFKGKEDSLELRDASNKHIKRDFINRIKRYYAKNKIIPDERLFKSFEKRWYYENNEFHFQLLLSHISNSFGLSVGLPLLWLVAFIFMETVIIFYTSGSCRLDLAENAGVFLSLLNPAHKTSLFIEILGDCNPPESYVSVVYLIDNIFRILIIYIIFQFVNAFRYKYDLR